MTVRIEICCDNAAFEDNLAGEVERILRQTVIPHLPFLEPGLHGRKLLDVNGNKVGFVELLP